MTTIAIWSNWPSTPTDFRAALPDDTLVVIKDEADLPRAAAAEVAFCGISLDRVRRLLAATPQLRWFHTPAAGVDSFLEIPDFRARGIALTNNSGSYDIQIAEHVLAFVLAASKRLHLYRDQQSRREWKDLQHDELRDQTLVVFGAGSIGGEVVRLASAMGMRVVAVRRRPGTTPGAQRVVTPDALADAAAEADYLIVAAPLTPATRGAISRDVIARMKRTAWIVNIARGPIVDEDALVDALREGRLGGAGLDTFAREPLPADSPLWSLPNVVVTPHASNSSPRVRQRTLALFAENVRRFKAGEPLLNRVDFETGY
ncbi:MAG TPA: D-2-hydroxyacid dehydrogenase [Candidatus Limnocylindria bacterium]|nr:D-2-hydroxyacid dehydrogenase [Candidatus Limnocylindria bacterium]